MARQPYRPRNGAGIPIINPAPRTDASHAHLLESATALGRYVVVKLVAPKTTPAGIHIPDVVRQALGFVVISIGAKVNEALGGGDNHLEVGDRVAFQGAQDMSVGGETFGFVDAGAIYFRLDRQAAAAIFETGPVLADFSGTPQ